MKIKAPLTEDGTPCLFPYCLTTLKVKHFRRPYTDAIALQWALVDMGIMKREEAEIIAKRPTCSNATYFIESCKDDISSDNVIPVSQILFKVITKPSIFGHDFNTKNSLSLLIYDALFGEDNFTPSKNNSKYQIAFSCKNIQARLTKK